MPSRKKKDPKEPSADLPFEKALERLEAIARRLEDEEDLPLDESLRLFEEGVALARACGRRLAEAEQKVEVLRRQADGSLAAEPLDAEDPEP